MDNEDFTRVGLSLGFSDASLRRYKADKANTLEATYFMLTDWSKTVLPEDARVKLVAALQDAKLVRLGNRVQKGIYTIVFVFSLTNLSRLN